MENGDPADLESHNTGNRRLFNGLCTAYIKLMEEIESPINFYNFKDQENEAVTNVKIYNNDIVNGYGTISFSMDNNITEKSNTDLSLVPISFRIIGRWEDASGNKYVFREDRSVDLLTPTCKVQNKCNWWYDDESETGHLNYMWKHSLMHLNSDSELLLEQNNNVIILKRSEGN
jgi:hypothetical protein